MSFLSRLPYSKKLRTAAYFVKSFGVGVDELKVLSRFISGGLFVEDRDEVHLKAAMEWLSLAQNVCGGKGVSNVYFFNGEWGVAYPETSGYIIATYLAYSDYIKDKSFFDRALQIGGWEIEIQAPSGGVYSSTVLRQTRVFNTGQVMLGWCTLYERTGERKYLDAAIRAGNYLVDGQEYDGAWIKDTYCGARTYHARVDWALLRLAKLCGDDRFAVAARKNLLWVLANQTPNGWFEQCGFNQDLPIMHVIDYTLRGLLECSLISDDVEKELAILPALIKTTDHLCRAAESQWVRGIEGMIPGAFDRNWAGANDDACLTGNAQFAYYLYKLSHVTGRMEYKTFADKTLSALKRTQVLHSSLTPITGAIAGSYPISHGYVPNGFPNWAAKFFADALLAKIYYEQKLDIPA